MIQGTLQLPKMAGKEISDGIVLIEEPKVRSDGKLVALANVFGCLCVVELKITLLP